MRRRSVTSIRRDGRGDHHGGQRGRGQVPEQVRRHQQQRGNRERADDTGQLRPGARGLGDRRARRTRADRKALEESGDQVGSTQPHHLLIRIDKGPGARGVRAREHAGVGERHEGNREAAEQHRDDVTIRDRRESECGQALRQRTEDRHAGTALPDPGRRQ